MSLQIFKWTANPLYMLIAFTGFILNLLNLLPLGPLDGGRISAAITKWMWLFGGGALVYKAVKQPNPLMIQLTEGAPKTAAPAAKKPAGKARAGTTKKSTTTRRKR